MKKILNRAFLGGALLLLVLQFFQTDKNNPPSDPTQDFIAMEQPPIEVAELVEEACYDCHSHKTEYPWYTNVAPLSWWITHHIKEGREHLNFSTWGTYEVGKKEHKLEECAEEIREAEMPLKSYTWTHTEARLTPEQVDLLVRYFSSKEQLYRQLGQK